MANDICARIIFQVLARDNFFVMKQLKIDKGKTDLRFYFSRLFLKISNRWWTQAIITKYQTIKEHKENQRNKYLKKHLYAPGKKFFIQFSSSSALGWKLRTTYVFVLLPGLIATVYSHAAPGPHPGKNGSFWSSLKKKWNSAAFKTEHKLWKSSFQAGWWVKTKRI